MCGPGTQQRVEVLKDRGYAVTDIVDAALNEFWIVPGCPGRVARSPEPGQRFPARLPRTGPFARWWWLSRLDRRSTAQRRLPVLTAATHRFATIEAEEDVRAGKLNRYSVIAL